MPGIEPLDLLYASVEREDAYLARTGITVPRGIDNPQSAGLVLPRRGR